MQSDRITDLMPGANAAANALVRLKPTGFFSYSRQDDELSAGKLSKIRALLLAEIQQQYGRDRVHLFQDVSAISHGADWEKEIRSSLDKSTFFIPIITPNFIQSEWCCAEVTIFLQREQKLFDRFPDLPRKSRIFPIHLIDVTNVDAYDRHVLAALEARQWMDFRPLRFQPLSDPSVHEAIGSLAASIREMLQVKVRKPLSAKERAAAAAQASAALARAADAKASPPAPETRPHVSPPEPPQERTVMWPGSRPPAREPLPEAPPKPAPEPAFDASPVAEGGGGGDAYGEWDDTFEPSEEDSRPKFLQYALPAAALLALLVVIYSVWGFWERDPQAAEKTEQGAGPPFDNYSWLEGQWSSRPRCQGERMTFVPTRDRTLVVTGPRGTAAQRVRAADFPEVLTETSIYTSLKQPQPRPGNYRAVDRIRIEGAQGPTMILRRCA